MTGSADSRVNDGDRRTDERSNSPFVETSEERGAGSRGRRRPWGTIALGAGFLGPYLVLVIMSLGSGWTFPRLLPDRLDGRPWRSLLLRGDGLGPALLTSLALSVVVAGLSTAAGLFIGRAVRRSRAEAWRYLMYLPFVASPVVVGVALYDLLVRLHGAGSAWGVVFVQTIFATSFAAIYFCESWTSKGDRTEHLVRTLGGSEWAVWRHAVWPAARGLASTCLLQTALYSWVDYGIVSVVGGGQVETLTMRLFAYLREANVNQAAMASLLLITPAVVASLIGGASAAVAERRASTKSFLREL